MKFFLFYILPLIIYAGIIFYFSSLSNVGISLSFDSGGLSLHFLEYIVFGFLVHRVLANLKTKYSGLALLIFSLAASILYGMTDEIHQSFVPNRAVSIIDLGADSLGAFVGILAYYLIKRKN